MLVVAVAVAAVVELSATLHSAPSINTSCMGLYPLEPLDRTRTSCPSAEIRADSGVLYKNGDFSTPDMNLASARAPPLCRTICATEIPADAEAATSPYISAAQTVIPPWSVLQTAATIIPKLPFDDVTRWPTRTCIASKLGCIQLLSEATSKYTPTRSTSTAPFPLVNMLARRCVVHPWCLATTCSTRTKIPKLTLLRKLASLPDTSVLWSASSAFWLCVDPAKIARTVGPSPPAKLIPR